MHRFAALVLALVTTACVPELAPLDDDTGAGLGQDGDKEPANGNGNGNGNGGDDTAPEDTCFYADELGNEIEETPARPRGSPARCGSSSTAPRSAGWSRSS